MIATVEVANVGLAGAVRALARQPIRNDVPGLRSAQVALFSPLAIAGPRPSVEPD